MLPILLWAAITKMLQMEWVINNRHLFISHSFGEWKTKIRVPARLGSGESLLSCCSPLTFFMFSHIQEKREKTNSL